MIDTTIKQRPARATPHPTASVLALIAAALAPTVTAGGYRGRNLAANSDLRQVRQIARRRRRNQLAARSRWRNRPASRRQPT